MSEVMGTTNVGHACGKIIISGNVAIKFGKQALAVPVDMHIRAVWDKGDDIAGELRVVWAGQGEIGIWPTTVRKIIKLIEASTGPLSGKVTIHNTLPLGKGMGSSTAIVVALARCFLGKNCKDEALAIENIINKGHSGIDFAAIWEERPIVITSGGKYDFIELPNRLQRGYLVDTGYPILPTSVIIDRLDKRSPREKNFIHSVEVIGSCTERLLAGEDPYSVFPDHHRGQVNLGVVPPRVRALVKRIEQSGGAAKAVRSGGGTGGSGMVFAVHPKVNVLRKVIDSDLISLAYDPLRRRFLRHGTVRSKGIPSGSVETPVL